MCNGRAKKGQQKVPILKGEGFAPLEVITLYMAQLFTQRTKRDGEKVSDAKRKPTDSQNVACYLLL